MESLWFLVSNNCLVNLNCQTNTGPLYRLACGIMRNLFVLCGLSLSSVAGSEDALVQDGRSDYFCLRGELPSIPIFTQNSWLSSEVQSM